MHGICGVYSPKDPTEATPRVLERMLAALDRNGTARRSFVDAEAGLALGHVHRGEGAVGPRDPVPGWHESDRAVVTLDGVIVDPSRATVGGDGEGDAVVARFVARALEENEAGFPGSLRGHFGLAAWSRGPRLLRLARDPLGTKSLYCFHHPATGVSVFSSELKGVLAHPAVSRGVDRDALACLLAFGFVPAPLGLIEGVRKVFPGEVLELDARGSMNARRYWAMPPYVPQPADVEELAAEARRASLESFRNHVDGHERVGVFLSGGVDSTVVLGILKLLGVAEPQAFTFGFRIGPARLAEDLAWAARAADAVGIPCRAVTIETGHDPGPALTRVWREFDDPVLSPNVHSRFLLAEAARREGTRLCLSGSTAGSLFGLFSDPQIAKLQVRAGTQCPRELMAYRANRIFPFDEIRDLLVEPPDDPRQVGLDVVERYSAGIEAGSVGDRVSLTKSLMVGAEKSVATQDRSARLGGVDMRQPFRDTTLLELSRRIPVELKGRRGKTKKQVLKVAFRDVLPDEIATRKTIGFPSYYWTGELEGLAKRLLSRRAVERAGLFRPDRVEQILEEDRVSRKKSAGKRTWALLATQAWHALHVERRGDLE